MNLHEEFLRTFFSSLNRMIGDYCVIHSYEELPFHSEGDIDIAISNINKNDIESLMIDVCNEFDWQITQRLWYDVPECFYYVLSSLKDHSVTLKIDLLFDENAIGYTHYSTGFLTDNPLIHNNIKHSNATAEFCYKLTKRIWKGYFTKSDPEHLSLLYKNSNKAIVQYQFSRQYGHKNASKIMQLFEKKSAFTGAESNWKELSSIQKKRYKYGSIIRFLSRLRWMANRVLHRVVYPCGIVITLPPDYSSALTQIKSNLSRSCIDSFRIVKQNTNTSFIDTFKALSSSELLLTINTKQTNTINFKLSFFSLPKPIYLNDKNKNIDSLIKIIDTEIQKKLTNRIYHRLINNRE